MDDSLRTRLVAFYAKYNPVRLQTIDAIIESWRDDEEGLFEALHEKYRVDAAEGGRMPHLTSGSSDTHPAEYVPPNLTPLEQLEYRCRKMEEFLTSLYSSSKEDRLTRDVSEFKNNAAAFSEVCLGILRDIRGVRNQQGAIKADVKDSTEKVTRFDEHIATSRSLEDQGETDLQNDGSPLVHDVMPIDADSVADQVLSAVIRTKCRDGDIINIFPGKYRDNISILGLRVQLQAASSAPDRPVVLLAADDSLPIVQASGNSSVNMSGIEFRAPEEAQAPLVAFDSGSKLSFEGCSFVGGGGGILLGDPSTLLKLKKCSFNGSSFAGVYAKAGAVVEMDDCDMTNCEVGVRVRDASANLSLTRIGGSYSDGVTFHGSCKGTLSRCTLTRSKENGAMLSPSSVVSFASCEVKSNGQFGIYVPAGAEFIADGCTFAENVMGHFNRAPSISAQLKTIAGDLRH